jgi:hypothetical protein
MLRGLIGAWIAELVTLMFLYELAQGLPSFLSNGLQMRIAAPVRKEILSVFFSQSAYESVPMLLADPPIFITMASVKTISHWRPPQSRALSYQICAS